MLGAGITGAMVAYELTRQGKRVGVVDRRPAGSGSTPASTALVQYELDTPLVKLAEMHGWERATVAYAAARDALRQLEEICGGLGADVGLVRRESLHLAVRASDAERFRKEIAARRAVGIAVSLLGARALRLRYGLARRCAIRSEEALEVNPLKLTYELLKAARREGAVVLPRTAVDLSGLNLAARPFRMALGARVEVVAQRLVLATGYETPEQFAEVAQLTELRTTFAIATEPVGRAPWKDHVLLWDAGDPYFYARTTRDGRVLAGGEDERFMSPRERDAMLGAKSGILMRRLHELVEGRRFRVAYRWGGTFAQTKDGLPYIGEHRRWPGVLFALGYGGNGITFSVVAAKIIAGEVVGMRHHSAGLFGFDR